MHFQRRLRDLYFTLFPFSCGESSSSKLVLGWKKPTSYMLTGHYWSSYTAMMRLQTNMWMFFSERQFVKLKDWSALDWWDSSWHCGQKEDVRGCYKILIWKIYFYLTFISLYHRAFPLQILWWLGTPTNQSRQRGNSWFWKRYLRLFIQDCAKINSL